MKFPWSKKKKKDAEVPKSWLDKTTSKTPVTEVVEETMPTVSVKPKRSFKIHVPYLLTVKRIIAAFLLIVNFFIAQAALTSAQTTQPLYLLFFLNALILLDYLWKTRRKTIEKEKWKAW